MVSISHSSGGDRGCYTAVRIPRASRLSAGRRDRSHRGRDVSTTAAPPDPTLCGRPWRKLKGVALVRPRPGSCKGRRSRVRSAWRGPGAVQIKKVSMDHKASRIRDPLYRGVQPERLRGREALMAEDAVLREFIGTINRATAAIRARSRRIPRRLRQRMGSTPRTSSWTHQRQGAHPLGLSPGDEARPRRLARPRHPPRREAW